MDKRDPKIKFQHQKDLQDMRPSPDPADIAKIRDAGRIATVQSFNIAMKSLEAAVILAIDGQEPMVIKLNPDVVLSLGINLLKAGNQMKWFRAELQDTDPPQLH